ncbi:MAG: HgcAB-associated protein [Leptospirales bacterium]
MKKNSSNKSSAPEQCDPSSGCCKVESMVTVDERGQMVLPKEIRDKAKIAPGDKLVLVTWEDENEVCCISLVKSEQIMGMVKRSLAPMAKEMLNVSTD